MQLGPWECLAEGVWRAVAEPESVNVGLVAGSERALLIDTGSTPAQGRAIRAAVIALTDVPLTHVVVTHAHYDHAFGLAAFTDLVTIGHARLATALTGANARAEAARLGVSPADLVAPNRPIELALATDLGGLRAEIVHFGPAHTSTDLVVVVPGADVVFAGDLLESSAPPSLGPDSLPESWPAALDGIIGVCGPDTRVVPGHGSVVDRVFAMTQRAQLSALWGQAERLAVQGVPLERALAAGEWPFEDATVAASLPHLYERLARLGVVPRPRLPLVARVEEAR